MKNLYVDMDGTVAQFYENEQYLEAMYEKNFFRELKPYKRVVSAIKLYMKENPHVKVFILSAYPSPSFAEKEKNEWLDEFLPIENRLFMEAGLNKANVVASTRGYDLTKDDFLFDDYTQNLLEWTNAGGYGIKVRNDFNCCKGIWHGVKVSIFDSPKAIVKNLEQIIG